MTHSSGTEQARPASALVIPPLPAYAPSPETAAGTAFLAWLRVPRPAAALGIWRAGHQPRPEQEPERTPGRRLIGGALLSAQCAWIVWSLLYDGYLGLWWLVPLDLLAPDDWVHGRSGPVLLKFTYYGYYAVVIAVLAAVAGRAGRWAEVWLRYLAPHLRPEAALPVPHAAVGEDPAGWPQLRAAGAVAAADQLAGDARAGAMGDVDHARITQAWTAVQAGRHPLDVFTRAVLEDGAAACGHPSGARDLPGRTAWHDLVTHQVRLGAAADTPRNPWTYRTAGIAVSPDTVGTSVVAVGPAGTGAVVRPIAEFLCLQALAVRAAVVAVGEAGADLGPAGQYDVTVRLGDPGSPYGLDLYGGLTDPDEAADVLAEALVGDLTDGQGGAGRVLGLLLGPFHTVHGRLPALAELRQLLDAAPDPLQDLRLALERSGDTAMLRELDAWQRQCYAPAGPGALLADRIALLDRPQFAASFGPSDVFSMAALEHPVRVYVELPARGHAEAGRILARLVQAQFLAHVARRGDRSLLACLVTDDAAGAVTAHAVRAMQRLRSANVATVLALRTLDDVAPALRGPLLAAAGCRIALAGLAPRDGQHFADTWGTAWTESRDVTDRQVIAETPGGRALHLVRQAITGKAPTAQAVTVRQVERERWSASDLAHTLPAAHAVISLTSTAGDRTPPILVNLHV